MPKPFHQWQSRNPDSINFDEQEEEKFEQEKIWQTMDIKVWEVQRAKLDGVLFRSEPIQVQKNTITDNSYIFGETNTYDSNKKRKETKVRCYGRIQKFYLHFMHPPPPQKNWGKRPRSQK